LDLLDPQDNRDHLEQLVPEDLLVLQDPQGKRDHLVLLDQREKTVFPLEEYLESWDPRERKDKLVPQDRLDPQDQLEPTESLVYRDQSVLQVPKDPKAQLVERETLVPKVFPDQTGKREPRVHKVQLENALVALE
jgi:hypothetical protein